MHCPICGNILKKLEVSTMGGIKFIIDHCGNCGGTWFDAFELNRVPYHDVVRIAKQTVLQKQIHSRPSTLSCPHDHARLELFQSESLPKEVEMYRCHKCGGYWATQKGLEILKDLEQDRVVHYSIKKTKYQSISAIVWPASFLVLLLVASFVTMTQLKEQQITSSQASGMIANLTVSPITSTAVTVSFQTKEPLSSSISYGKTIFDMKTLPISQSPSLTHGKILIGLYPNSVYIYKITLTDELGKTFTLPENSFTTGE